jgi:hypothetical protein
VSGFNLFIEVCGHSARGHVPPLVSCLLFAFRFLTLEKQFGNIHPIIISEMTYCLVVYTLVIQFRDTLMEHFNPHQFGVRTRGGCETMVHNIQVMLDLHLDLVVLQVDVCKPSI